MIILYLVHVVLKKDFKTIYSGFGNLFVSRFINKYMKKERNK